MRPGAPRPALPPGMQPRGRLGSPQALKGAATPPDCPKGRAVGLLHGRQAASRPPCPPPPPARSPEGGPGPLWEGGKTATGVRKGAQQGHPNPACPGGVVATGKLGPPRQRGAAASNPAGHRQSPDAKEIPKAAEMRVTPKAQFRAGEMGQRRWPAGAGGHPW